MEDGQLDDKVFATFEKYDEFYRLQSDFLRLCSTEPAGDERGEVDLLLKKLSMIVSLLLTRGSERVRC